MARERQVQSASQAKSVNGCDHWLSAARNYRHHALPTSRKLESLRALKLREFGDIGSHRKRSFAAGDHNAGEFVRFRQACHLASQRGHYRAFEAGISVIAFQFEKKHIFARGRDQASIHRRVRLRAELLPHAGE